MPQHYKIYYQPNGGISAIPDLIEEFDIKVFGCRSISDYNNGQVLFSKLTGATNIFIREVMNYSPNMVFIESLTPKMVLAVYEIRKFYNGPIILFFGDAINRNSIILLREIARYVDHCFVLDDVTARRLSLEKLPVSYTVFPASSKIYKPDPNAVKIFDAVFAGNIGRHVWWAKNSAISERLKLIQAFSKRPRFGLFGGENWKNYQLNVIGWVDEYRLAKIYNQSKIVLASDQITNQPHFTSNRTTKALLGRSFLLIKKFNGIDDIFINHQHLVWFETVEEALELADYYLLHEDKRERVAEEGYYWAIHNADLLSFFHRCTNISSNREYKYNVTEKLHLQMRLLYHYFHSGIVRILGEANLISRDWFHFAWENSSDG